MTAPVHTIEKRMQLPYYIAFCTCGWQSVRSTAIERARAIMAHYKDLNLHPRTGEERPRACPTHGEYPAAPGFCCPDLR